jgi:N-formylglutamate amidohydrolase
MDIVKGQPCPGRERKGGCRPGKLSVQKPDYPFFIIPYEIRWRLHPYPFTRLVPYSSHKITLDTLIKICIVRCSPVPNVHLPSLPTPTLMRRYPFLVSVPHGGTRVPEEVLDLVALTPDELAYYSDPATRALYQFHDRVVSYLDTEVSRMVVDLNRPPYHLPPRYPDGVIKLRTVHDTPVFRDGDLPDIRVIHRLLMDHYFPYHAEIDRLLDPNQIAFAVDCHSMLPHGPPAHRDAGKERPLICLGNNGDDQGRQRPGSLSTCPAPWIQALAAAFREEFGESGDITINKPFSGGFISNAHFWHKGIPWVQIEVNRSLYENSTEFTGMSSICHDDLLSTGKRTWSAICSFWDHIDPIEHHEVTSR